MLKSKIFMKKTKKGSILKVVREHYLRDDISCGLETCHACKKLELVKTEDRIDNGSGVYDDTTKSTIRESLSDGHRVKLQGSQRCQILIPDTNVVLHQVDMLEDECIKNVVILSTVLEEVKHQSLTIFKRIKDLLANPERLFYVFINEHHCETYIERERGESANDRNDRAIRVAAHWYSNHLSDQPIDIVLLTNDRENRNKALSVGNNKLAVYSAKEYVSKLESKSDLVDKVASSDAQVTGKDRFEYPSHLSQSEIKLGLTAGKLHKGKFHSSRDNYLEGEVMVDGRDKPLFIQGRENLNRAVNDDIVAIEILPEAQWSCPSALILDEHVEENDADLDKGMKDKSNMRASARVVGIMQRNWRQYCGILQTSTLTETNRHLFVAAERRIPKVRIETRQYDALKGKRIIVAIDSWPRNSRYPQGHFVRVLGDIGDKATENEVLLLEHDIPHTAFSQRVLNCLPSADWTISDTERSKRADFRSLTICSVDPPGCTDIDDALHCKPLDNGNFQVGVHIADVTHFVRPGTALDQEASNRSTTVYLTDRRIDMVPELLSSNLCSLRSNVERCAFSCLWEITPDAKIVKTEFMKSIILSKASLTYGDAQDIIDSNKNDELAANLRNLNSLAKKLKARRMEAGALTLASPEVRFEMDSETMDPIQVTDKKIRDTNSMVEEFMLLANGSVAKKIYEDFPLCAVLRRHPEPPYSNFDPMLSVCKAYGLEMDVTSNKALSHSLDKAVLPGNTYFNTMLRILTTRCMMQAKYFASGMMPERDFYHYGLAMKFYTHFTSPIRRYADVMVHRLLAVAIGADTSYPELMDKQKTQEILQNVNYRHVMAQHASRASVGLHTMLFFKQRTLDEQGYVLNIKKNGLQVLIPKYGLEGTIYTDKLKPHFDEEACTQTVSGHVFHIFDPVTVQVSLDDTNVQHQKLKMQLVKPQVAGLTLDFNEAPSERSTMKSTPRKKAKKS